MRPHGLPTINLISLGTSEPLVRMGDVDEKLATLLMSLRELLPNVSPNAAAAAAAELAELQRAFAASSSGESNRLPTNKELPVDESSDTPVPEEAIEEGLLGCDDTVGADKVDAQVSADEEEQVDGEPARSSNAAKNRKKRAAQKAKKHAAKLASTNCLDVAAAAPIIELPGDVRGSVRVFSGSRGRGLQCTRQVKRGEILIGIPRAWAISTSLASRSGGCTGQTALALELVALRRQRDFRLMHMPAYNDMPCFWSEAQLELLRPSMVLASARNQRATLEAMYQQLAPVDCTRDEFVWAMAMVQSRTFGGGAEMVILPFIDLINTETAPDLDFDVRRSDEMRTSSARKGGKTSSRSSEAHPAYINVHASRTFEEGEEALVSYHGKSAPSLFSNFLAYGFVPTNGVAYPERLDPWDSSTDEETLHAIMARWQTHISALSAASVMTDSATAASATSSEGMDNDLARRTAIARELLTHERCMAIAEIAAIEKHIDSRR